ncbi:MAG: branched-chain amino acid ABC transporter substrate-binding protein [Nitrosomonadaceae bacterium]|nr:branched-chain amino acid ABC transporter substrate-binding protein [Nitrosomonadaceae bacterium]
MRFSGRFSFGLAAAILILSGCKETLPLPKVDELLVKIGHAAPLTGTQAHIGKDNENGVRLAIEEANAAGIVIGGQKVRFQLLSEDDQADPKNGTIVAHKLADAEINGMIGHLNSGTTIPASRVYHDAGIPQISPSATNPKYTQQGFKSAFRTMANDVQQGRLLGQFVTRHLAAKRIAIIDDRTAYGQGLADEFEKSVKANGGIIVAREFTTDKSTDFRAILTAIKGKQPDVLFFGGMDPQGGPLMRQVRSLGITAQFLGGDGVYTPEFIKLAGDAAEGAYGSLPGVPLEKMPSGIAFRDKYRAKYNREIQLYAPFCYDAVNIMIEAMKRADSVKPEKYLPELAKTDYNGVTARIVFDEKGDLKAGAVTFYRVRNGKWEVAETLSSAPAEPASTAAAMPVADDRG